MAPRFKAGDLVEVRSREEILASLDHDGCLERMPFMPEMLEFAGKRFRVSAVAHKTCDSAHKTGGRRLTNSVHLEDLRCDGSAHDGCQATCLLFWKTAWLKPVGKGEARTTPRSARITIEALQAATRRKDSATGRIRYACQATQLYDATTLLPWWDVRQFWTDIACGNVSVGRALRVLTVAMARTLTSSGIAYRAAFWIYDRVHRVLNGWPAPRGSGMVPKGSQTPECNLGLREGEVVRVRSHEEIKATLNAGNRNRGLWFDHEMVKFCGKEYTVSGRVNQIIDEVTGEMLYMKQPCIVLNNVFCTAEYTAGRLLCRRAVTTYWREAWLERVQPTAEAACPEAAPGTRTKASSANTR